MYPFKTAIITDGFKTDIFTALKKSASLGVKGVQIYTFREPMLPQTLTKEERRAILTCATDWGIEITATCGNFNHAFDNDQLNQVMIDETKQQIELALDLGAKIITGHIGDIPENKNTTRYQIMLEGCSRVAEFSKKAGVIYAAETGPETSLVLKEFLDTVHSSGLGANLDPANFIMVAGENPVDAVYNLKDHIVYTHAKDGIKNPVGSKIPYTVLPLGKGDVPFERYFDALQEIGYCGWMAIEREWGNAPDEDIKEAVDFLTQYI